MTSTLLVLGGTGRVGSQIIAQALAHPLIDKVIAPTRRPLLPHAKLLNPIVDFSALPQDADWWRADAALNALGTTRKLAGSESAFRKIDHDFVIDAARLARNADTNVFVNNSSIGVKSGTANSGGSFYLRVKGETERDLAALGFASLCHVRPSLLDVDDRADFRLGERIGILVFRCFAPLIPRRYRAVSTASVAKVMLDAALAAKPGITIVESDALHVSV